MPSIVAWSVIFSNCQYAKYYCNSYSERVVIYCSSDTNINVKKSGFVEMIPH